MAPGRWGRAGDSGSENNMEPRKWAKGKSEISEGRGDIGETKLGRKKKDRGSQLIMANLYLAFTMHQELPPDSYLMVRNHYFPISQVSKLRQRGQVVEMGQESGLLTPPSAYPLQGGWGLG